MQIFDAQPLKNEDLEDLGLSWHTDIDNTSYVSNEIIEISEEEAQGFYNAANELYDMFVEAAEYVIKNNLFFELGIPFNAIEMIKMSWEDEIHWHLYGRFDFAGGLMGSRLSCLSLMPIRRQCFLKARLCNGRYLRKMDLRNLCSSITFMKH